MMSKKAEATKAILQIAGLVILLYVLWLVLRAFFA